MTRFPLDADDNLGEVNISDRRLVTSIAISGLAYTGKTMLAKSIAERLEWKYVSVGGLVRDLAIEAGIPIQDFGSLDESVLRKFDEEVKRRMESFPHTVWEGRLTAWLATAIPQVLSV